MSVFPVEYYVLLTDSELAGLASARNRDEFQPGLRIFLNQSRRLQELRNLALPSKEILWTPPVFSLTEEGGVVDQDGKIRGKVESFPLPTRPGEPQMAVSYDWFWSEFSFFLRAKHNHAVWTELSETDLRTVAHHGRKLDWTILWSEFWQKLSSKEHLATSVAIYLENKTLFKNPAKAWGPQEIPILSRDMAEFLNSYYAKGSARKRLFKEASVQNAIESVKNLIKVGEYPLIPLPLAFSNWS